MSAKLARTLLYESYVYRDYFWLSCFFSLSLSLNWRRPNYPCYFGQVDCFLLSFQLDKSTILFHYRVFSVFRSKMFIYWSICTKFVSSSFLFPDRRRPRELLSQRLQHSGQGICLSQARKIIIHLLMSTTTISFIIDQNPKKLTTIYFKHEPRGGWLAQEQYHWLTKHQKL